MRRSEHALGIFSADRRLRVRLCTGRGGTARIAKALAEPWRGRMGTGQHAGDARGAARAHVQAAGRWSDGSGAFGALTQMIGKSSWGQCRHVMSKLKVL